MAYYDCIAHGEDVDATCPECYAALESERDRLRGALAGLLDDLTYTDDEGHRLIGYREYVFLEDREPVKEALAALGREEVG